MKPLLIDPNNIENIFDVLDVSYEDKKFYFINKLKQKCL